MRERSGHKDRPAADSTATVNVPASIARRREAALRLPPLWDGRRDPDLERRHRRGPDYVIAIKADRALVKGWEAMHACQQVSADPRWSAMGRGWVVESRYVPDLLAYAQANRLLAVLSEVAA